MDAFGSEPGDIDLLPNLIDLNNSSVVVSVFGKKDVIRVAKRLNPKKFVGSNEIPSFFIRNLICVLARPLCGLFNSSLVQGTYLNRWKKAKICPIHKKGDREDVENYRPVALICGFPKFFEMFFYDYLIRDVKPLLSHNQHGFLGDRSIAINLTCFTQFTYSDTIDKQGQID